jgi:uncharacterized membrane protein
MNKIFLVVRIILLVALLFLLAAVFWGLANHESTEAIETEDIYERYQQSRPSGYTTFLLIALVVLGIFIVIASIFLEYHRFRKESEGAESRALESDKWS